MLRHFSRVIAKRQLRRAHFHGGACKTYIRKILVLENDRFASLKFHAIDSSRSSWEFWVSVS